jgi:hypothetical protein
MSHVKRNGKCYDLEYHVTQMQGFELIGYSFIISSTLVLTLLGLLVDWRVSAAIFVIGCLILGYTMYSDRANTKVDLSRGKEVQCPPADYDFKKQRDDFSKCVADESMSKCPIYMTECAQPFEKCNTVGGSPNCLDTYEQCSKKYPGCPPKISDTCNSILKYIEYGEN